MVNSIIIPRSVFILLQSTKQISSLYTAITLLSFFIIDIAFILSFLFARNLQAFHHKKQSKGTERDGSSLCADEVMQETRRPTAPSSPPAFCLQEEQRLCRQR